MAEDNRTRLIQIAFLKFCSNNWDEGLFITGNGTTITSQGTFNIDSQFYQSKMGEFPDGTSETSPRPMVSRTSRSVWVSSW